jgi:hypothetical protein
MWAERIALIPDFCMEDVMEAATTVGLPNNKKLECIDFMKKRRSEMGSIVENHIGQFPKLPKVTP